MKTTADRARVFWLLAVALTCQACGEDVTGSGGTGGATPPPSLIIDNRSQFELEEIRTHSTESDLDSDNLLLGEPLREKEELIIPVFYGPRFVTVFRRQTANGPLIALSTAEPISLPDDGYSLLVYDDSFRLLRSPSGGD